MSLARVYGLVDVVDKFITVEGNDYDDAY